jgi:hypothetical protein
MPGLAEELCATRFTMHKDKMLAEPKELVKKRIKKSPDMADTIVCSFATPDRMSSKLPQVAGIFNGRVEGFDHSGITRPGKPTQVQGFGGGYGRT